MIRPTPIWRSVALLGVAGVVLTACGGSSGGDTAAGTKSPSASSPAAGKGDGVLKIGTLLETHKHTVDDILTEARDHEKVGLEEYRKLLKLVADKNMMLEEYARAQIAAEELHLAEIGKMMRRH